MPTSPRSSQISDRVGKYERRVQHTHTYKRTHKTRRPGIKVCNKVKVNSKSTTKALIALQQKQKITRDSKSRRFTAATIFEGYE